MPDIDIDFTDRTKILEVIENITAMRMTPDGPTAHNTGIYAQYVPHDPVTTLSSIDYKQAEQRGYYKIDFLNVNVYKGVRNEEHLVKLMETEPLWELLKQDEFTDLLFH